MHVTQDECQQMLRACFPTEIPASSEGSLHVPVTDLGNIEADAQPLKQLSFLNYEATKVLPHPDEKVYNMQIKIQIITIAAIMLRSNCL